MYRKRIGNVVFFPGVEAIARTANDIQRSVLARKAFRLEQLSKGCASSAEHIIDSMLEAMEASAGGAR